MVENNTFVDMKLRAIEFVVAQDKKIIDSEPGKLAKELKR